MTTPEEKLLRRHGGDPHDWDGEERRKPERNILFDLIAEQNEKLDNLAVNVADYTQKLENHIKGEEHLVKLIVEGFPDDDPRSHRKYHEAKIKEAEARAEMYQKIKWELAKWGLVGLAAWLGKVLWEALLRGPK